MMECAFPRGQGRKEGMKTEESSNKDEDGGGGEGGGRRKPSERGRPLPSQHLVRAHAACSPPPGGGVE